MTLQKKSKNVIKTIVNSVIPTKNRKTMSFITYVLMASMSVGVVSMMGCSAEQREQAEQTLGLDEQDVFSLQVGTCFNDEDGDIDSGSGEEITDVPIRECNKPHDYEVYHLFELTGDSLPSAEEFDRQIEENCIPAFEEYVGKSYDESIYAMSTLSPSLDTWKTGDHEVVCFLYNDRGEQLTESIKGKNM